MFTAALFLGAAVISTAVTKTSAAVEGTATVTPNITVSPLVVPREIPTVLTVAGDFAAALDRHSGGGDRASIPICSVVSLDNAFVRERHSN